MDPYNIPPPEEEAPPKLDPTKQTIVLAEDDPFISHMYQVKLEIAGYNVLVCRDGRESYETIKSTHPQMVLLDINMPELTGLEVYRTLKQNGYDFTKTVVIVLTNSGDPKDRKAASDLGLDFIIKADMTPKSVMDLIAQKLSTKKA